MDKIMPMYQEEWEKIMMSIQDCIDASQNGYVKATLISLKDRFQREIDIVIKKEEWR